MKTTLKLALGLLISSSIILTGCQKDSTGDPDNTQKEEFAVISSQSETEAQIVFDDAFNNALGLNSEVGIGGTGVFEANTTNTPGSDLTNSPTGPDTCYVITATHLSQTEDFPVKFEIDFGAGCTGRDGKTRKGKMFIEYSNRLLIPGATATTTFENFYVNGVKVEGTHIIRNTSVTVPRLAVEVDGKLTKENGNYIEWVSNRTIEMTTGFQTPYNAADDILEVSGTASGTVKLGDKLYQWATGITNPLIRKFTCRNIIQGSVSLTGNNGFQATLDYGTGTCDNEATLTVNGIQRIITLN